DAVVHVTVVAVAPDLGGLHPGRPVFGAVLLVEHLSLDPVGEALEGEGAIAEVGQQGGCDPRVIVDHLALGEADLGIEHLVQVGQPQGAVADADLDRVLCRAHVAGRSRTTWRGSFRSRRALKAPARTWPARVHSTNSNSPTSRGSTKWASPGVLTLKGESGRSSGFSSRSSRASVASVKPVPTRPAYTKRSPSQ